jgi:hypothetical protein
VQITVVGKASGRETLLALSNHDLTKNLMFYLRDRGITIASSCDGEGVCQKCAIQCGWLTCQLTLEQFLERQPDGKVFIDYL